MFSISQVIHPGLHHDFRVVNPSLDPDLQPVIPEADQDSEPIDSEVKNIEYFYHVFSDQILEYIYFLN